MPGFVCFWRKISYKDGGRGVSGGGQHKERGDADVSGQAGLKPDLGNKPGVNSPTLSHWSGDRNSK